jgi:hypothetical protein
MYGLEFRSKQGAGLGTLILENGRAYGADMFGVKFDGDYVYHEKSGLAQLRLKLTFPPNVEAVFGISNPYEWSVDVTTNLDPRKPVGRLQIATPLGMTWPTDASVLCRRHRKVLRYSSRATSKFAGTTQPPSA